MTTANGNPTRYGLASTAGEIGRAAFKGVGHMAKATSADPKGALGIAAGGYGVGRVHQKTRNTFKRDKKKSRDQFSAMPTTRDHGFAGGNMPSDRSGGGILSSHMGYAAEEDDGSNDRLETAKQAMRDALGDQYCNEETDSYAADESPSDARGALALPVQWTGTDEATPPDEDADQHGLGRLGVKAGKAAKRGLGKVDDAFNAAGRGWNQASPTQKGIGLATAGYAGGHLDARVMQKRKQKRQNNNK